MEAPSCISIDTTPLSTIRCVCINSTPFSACVSSPSASFNCVPPRRLQLHGPVVPSSPRAAAAPADLHCHGGGGRGEEEEPGRWRMTNARAECGEMNAPCFISGWLALVMQWSSVLETRRSFIAGLVRKQFGHLATNHLPHLVSPQLVTETNHEVFARRVALVTLVLAVGTASWSSPASASNEEDDNLKRSFLQSLGIGDADIYYPRLFQGTWSCDSTLVAVDAPQGEEKVDKKSVDFSRKQLGYTVRYKARFIPFQNKVIGDRLFTTMSLLESTVGRNIVDHGLWKPEKPDRLSLVLQGGLKVQNVVTKRSFSTSGPGRFDTSEYSQQIFDNPTLEGGPPTIKASQNRTRYRWDTTAQEVSYIEAFQRVSMFPVVQEGLQNVDIIALQKPVTVYKYILRFSRESG